MPSGLPNYHVYVGKQSLLQDPRYQSVLKRQPKSLPPKQQQHRRTWKNWAAEAHPNRRTRHRKKSRRKILRKKFCFLRKNLRVLRNRGCRRKCSEPVCRAKNRGPDPFRWNSQKPDSNRFPAGKIRDRKTRHIWWRKMGNWVQQGLNFYFFGKTTVVFFDAWHPLQMYFLPICDSTYLSFKLPKIKCTF